MIAGSYMYVRSEGGRECYPDKLEASLSCLYSCFSIFPSGLLLDFLLFSPPYKKEEKKRWKRQYKKKAKLSDHITSRLR